MRQISLPKSHPYIASVTIDPVEFQRLRQRAEDQPELRFLGFDDDKPDNWTVRIGCASRAIASKLEEAWG